MLLFSGHIQEHAARSQEENIMPRLGSILILLCTFTLVTAACGGDGGQQAATEIERTRTTEAPKAARKIPEEGQPLPPGKYLTTKFKPALSFRVVDEGWVNVGREQPDSFFFAFGQREVSVLLGFATPLKVYDPERLPKQVAVPAPKDWVAWYRNHPYLETGKATSVTVGGVSGMQFETEVSSVPRDYPKVCGQTPCIPVLETSDLTWIMTLGDKDQITILDVGGETVIIDILAPEDDFEKLLPKAQKVIDTVEWEASS
jgi:hypothetical protein